MLGIATSLDGARREARGAVEDLAGEVRRLGERHAADHDVHHMSRTLGLLLDEAAAGLGAEREPDPEREGGRFARVREAASKAVGSRPPAGALLLADLRRFLGSASDASIACVVLAQGAQAARDRELLQAVTVAHDAVLRTHRWALTRLKVTAPQVLLGP